MANGSKFIAAFAAVMLCISSAAADNTSVADKLNSLGLFHGTDNGYELESELTREQGATMIVRLMGEEERVLETEYDPVFDDVKKDRWSFPYVMYCYKNKVTMGTSSTEFTPEENMTAQQYICFILRLLGYTHAEPETAGKLAVETGLISSSNVKRLEAADKFLRDDMVYISYSALKTRTASGDILAYKLSDRGVISSDEANKINPQTSAETVGDLVDKFFE